MNEMQRRRAAETASNPPAVMGGHWLAGGRLSFSGMVWPRGAVLPDEIVASIPPYRLSILMSNKLVVHRLGPAPADAPAATAIIADDPKAERAAIMGAMSRDGYQPHELDHREKAPPGYGRAHPSVAIRSR